MDEVITPTRAYDLLTDVEREAVDTYMRYVIQNQRERRERIMLALKQPIPAQFMRQSRGVLAKPVPRAALAERIKEEADKQDLSPSRVIEEYRRIAYASQTDFFEQGHFGEFQLKPMDKIPQEMWSAVKTVRMKPTMNGMTVELDFHPKLLALDTLVKMMGVVPPDKAPILEDYSTDLAEQHRMLQAPEEIYAQLLEGA